MGIVKLNRLILAVFFLISIPCNAFGGSRVSFSRNMPAMRAVWVQSRSIATAGDIDQVLARVERGHFNAIFVEVFVYGYAYYESDILEKYPDIAPGYNPLAYIIEQAHGRGIEVHAWLIAGPVGGGRRGPSPILSQNPDWAMVSLDDENSSWLNYNRPDVRQFIGDIAVELVQEYDLDGIHFDYTRYPGPEWGFDFYSTQIFAGEYGIDPDLLRYSELPAYGKFKGNPLVGVETAQVLAKFHNGRPAVLLNGYGRGEVLLLNWEAERRDVAASSEILRRGIEYLLGSQGAVYILRSETNAEKYGYSEFDRVFAWLEDIGWSPIEVTEDRLPTLDADAVLVMPHVYLISDRVATDLTEFVDQGGGLFIIDGPTPSIGNKDVQAITGMRGRGRHFWEPSTLVAVEQHDIIPTNDRELGLAEARALGAQWNAFRKQGINKLLQVVYHRVKKEDRDVLVSITISADREALAQEVMLDWKAWLEEGYVDLIVPRAYVDQDQSLAPVIADWRSVLEHSDRVMLGLKIYAHRRGREVKMADRILSEIQLAYNSGSNGIILFDNIALNDDILEALAAGPFSASDISSE